MHKDETEKNIFLQSLPSLIDKTQFLKEIKSGFKLPDNLPNLSTIERLELLPKLSTLFFPMHYMYVIYEQLHRAIATTYSTRTTIDTVRQTNAIFLGEPEITYATQTVTGSILGVPGIGKTSTVKRCLSVLPQVVEHIDSQLYCKQILYLYIECPSDCSVKTLAFNILGAIDNVIGSQYLKNLTNIYSASASSLASQVKILCMTHHVGLILVDEIQNAVVTAQKNRQIKPLIKFLVELTNDTCTAVYFIGTNEAEELFVSEEHLKRRTRGIRLLPLKPDGLYRNFLDALWVYQITPCPAVMTDKLINKLYDWSAGIPAYIVKIFQESQAQALYQGKESFDIQIMKQTIDMLSIRVPKTFSGGIYISDFEEKIYSKDEIIKNEEQPEIPRLYFNKRGRTASERDEDDLVFAFRNGIELYSFLNEKKLLERSLDLC